MPVAQIQDPKQSYRVIAYVFFDSFNDTYRVGKRVIGRSTLDAASWAIANRVWLEWL